MKKKLTNNLGLKLLAVLVSFALWLVVVNYDDPVISNTYSGIPVEIINADALTDQGKVYEILNNTDTISVTVTGKRSVVESIGRENIRAIADMEDLTLMDTVGIQLSTDKNYNQLDSIESDQEVVELAIENRQEINMPINVQVTGEPGSGYIVGDISTNQNTVRISGPESVVSRITRVSCEVNVGGRTSDVTTQADIRMYDANGDVVEHPNLTMNTRYINVSAEVLATKAVEIIYNYSGTLEEGYVISGDITADRMAIYLAGRQNALDAVSVLEIPATAINVEGKNETFTTTIDLERYLPEGTELAEQGFDGRVAVTVPIEETVNRNLNIPIDNVSVNHVPNGYEAEILINSSDVVQEGTAGEVRIRISTVGLEDAYDNVSGRNVFASVDINSYLETMDQTELLPGVYRMEIQFYLPEGVETTQTYYADIKIQEIEE